MKMLRRDKYFEYDTKELLGIMRFDFYDGELANRWNPRELIKKLKDNKKVDLKKLQYELNFIQFDMIKNYEKVIELSNGEGYDKEILLYIDLEVAKYVIKLVPVKDSYSYIYVYMKENI